MGEQTYGRHNEIMVVNDDGSINTNLYSDGQIISSAAPLPVSMDSDIQIGAVEIKDGESDTRQKVKSDGTDNAAVVTQNSQPLPTGAATSAKQLADGHNVTANAGTNLNTSALATEATMTADLQSIEDNQTDGTQRTQIVNGDNTAASITTNPNTLHNELAVNLEGHECTANTTATQLDPDEEFVGSGWQDTLDYGVLSINVATDVDSATDGLEIQWSNDGLTVYDTDKFTILANNPKTFTFGPAERYYRIKYINGSSATTTSFHLTSILRKVYVKSSSHRITDNIVGEDDAELVKAVLTGKLSDGTFDCLAVAISRIGRLETNPTSYYHAYGSTAGVTLKQGAGTIHTIIFGSAANNAVVTISDSSTAATPVLWEYDATGALDVPISVDMGCLPFSNALRITVTNSASFTIVYE